MQNNLIQIVLGLRKKIDTIYMLSNMLTHCTSDTLVHIVQRI